MFVAVCGIIAFPDVGPFLNSYVEEEEWVLSSHIIL